MSVTDTSQRLAESMGRDGLEWFLASSPAAVTYVSGYVPPVETGPSPFAGGPDLALVARDGTVVVLVEQLHADAAQSTGVQVLTYEGYTPVRAIEAVGPYRRAVEQMLATAGVGGSVGVELETATSLVVDVLRSRGVDPRDGRGTLRTARAIKTPRERDLLRTAAQVASAGHRELVATLRRCSGDLPSEIELFGVVRAAMERRAGARVPVAGDLVAGIDRCAGVGGWPGRGRFGPGEPVIADLAPCVDGYWADSASTVALEPGPELRAMYGVVRDALDAGAQMLRPGVAARAVHEVMHTAVERAGFSYSHHSGHGVGTTVHEFPRIVAQENAPLREGMVICLEPGAYMADVGGVRLEWMCEIGAQGPTLLTDFPLELAL